MLPPEWYLIGAKIAWLGFVVAVGACVGSLTNVLVYRMPRGQSVVTPASRCPHCGVKLTFRENVPILGWLVLRGRCRFCRSKISPEYVIVELCMALLFGGVFALWYLTPVNADGFMGLLESTRPGFADVDAMRGWPQGTWPLFLIVMTLLSTLVGMSLVDAKTYTIPLPLPWTATVVAIVAHPLYAWWASGSHLAPREAWLPDASSWILGAGLGAVVGLAASWGLVRGGLIRRSFADYEEWEREAIAKAKTEAGESPDAEGDEALSDPAMWLMYPHARREVVLEIIYLTPAVTLGLLGGWVAQQWLTDPLPMWAAALGASLWGYLMGAGIVWGMRILGSLAFGKEAMGLGDVHLLGAVGAALGWIDAVLAFFTAAIVGVVWVLVSGVIGGKVARQMPYGPYLAIATLIVLLAKPAYETLLTYLLAVEPGAAPINLP